MRWRRFAGAVAVLIVALAAIAFVYAWRSSIAAAETPNPGGFDRAVVGRGASVAAAGFCAVCHSAAGRPAFAGGRPLVTPVGTIYATNITPDRETGIGSWSEAAFLRAMREGVDREGRHLYPAFPYDHFTHASEDDLKAVYAFLMTRPAIRQTPPANTVIFPFNVRMILAGWKLFFLHQTPFARDSAQSEAWNRGAYLAETLGHCGACHTPRNLFMAEMESRHFDGGEAEGWWSPAINAHSDAPLPWTADQLYTYLRTGWDSTHGAASGPMAPVTRSLATLPDADVRAIATYVASGYRGQTVPASTPATPQGAIGLTPAASGADSMPGAAIYAGACALCHDARGDAEYSARPLAQHTSVASADPRNVLHVILNGLQPPDGQVGARMPAFTGTLTDRQIADVAAYVRARFGSGQPWGDLDAQIKALPHGGDDS